MSDNVAISAGTGTTISTEEITTLNGGAVSAQHMQRTTPALRTADGTAVDLPGDAANGLDVDVTRLPALAAGTNTVGNVHITDGTNFLPTADAAARALYVRQTDGTNSPAIKAASTAAAAADPSLVVALSPNSPLAPMAAASSTPTGVVSLGNSQGKTVVGATGALASSATTANQSIATRTVTAAKTFYVTSVDVGARLTTFATTATLFGVVSLRINGTAIAAWELAAGGMDRLAQQFGEPLPVAAGIVVDLVVTPAAATAITWRGSITGYEK